MQLTEPFEVFVVSAAQVAPADVPNRSGEDPHEAPRRAPWGQVQKSDFLSVGGVVTNPQPGGAPYFAWGWDGITGL